jgi:ABC-type uncharacterized transport system substrate-binding protein
MSKPGGDPYPVGSGFVTSLARPGGNVTGISPAFVHLIRRGTSLVVTPGVTRTVLSASR